MAYLFDDALSQWIDWADGSTPTYLYPFTLAAWLRPDALNITSMPFSFGDIGGAANVSLIIRNARLGGLVVDQLANIAEATTTADMTVDTWHHGVIVAADTTTHTAYLDGGNAGSDPTNVTNSFPANRVAVGRYTNVFAGYYYSGRVAEAAMWLATLDVAEIAALAKGYSPALIRPSSLFFYAPLVRELTERSGKALTAHSGPTVADHVRVLNPARTHIGENTFAAPPAGQPTALRDWVRHTGRPWRPQRGL